MIAFCFVAVLYLSCICPAVVSSVSLSFYFGFPLCFSLPAPQPSCWWSISQALTSKALRLSKVGCDLFCRRWFDFTCREGELHEPCLGGSVATTTFSGCWKFILSSCYISSSYKESLTWKRWKNWSNLKCSWNLHPNIQKFIWFYWYQYHDSKSRIQVDSQLGTRGSVK